jgi:hypothetical protein
MDRVKLRALERAELNDTLALSDLVYEYTERMLGGLFGAGDVVSAPRGGALSLINASYDSQLGTLSLESFQFLELKRGGADLISNLYEAAPEARIVRFNSADQNHINHPIDISAASNTGTTYQIYVRSITVDSDTDFRRQWDINAQQEVSASMTTRRRERCEFTVGKNNVRPSESTTAGVGKWIYISDYTLTINSVSTVTKWAWDEGTEKLLAQLSQIDRPTLDQLSSNAILQSIVNSGSTAGGLSVHLAAYKLMMWYMLESGSTDTLHQPSANADWFGRPPYSLKELAQLVDGLRTDSDANASDITELNTNTRGSQQTFYYTAVVYAKYNDNTNQMTQLEIEYHRPGGQAGTNFTVDFDASEVTTAPAAAVIDTLTKFRSFVGYPVLIFGNEFNNGFVTSLTVVPHVGKENGNVNSSIEAAAWNDEAPIDLAWGYRSDPVPAYGAVDLPNQITSSRLMTTQSGRGSYINGVKLALNLDHADALSTGIRDISFVIQATVQKAQ